jgi:hypothetical protein
LSTISIVTILFASWACAGDRNVSNQPPVVIEAQAAGAIGDGQTDNLDTLTSCSTPRQSARPFTLEPGLI